MLGDNEEPVDRRSWQPIVELLDAVATEARLVEGAVEEVRRSVEVIGRLPAEDVARHTRALLAAAVRAIAERRGPSEAELAFIEELAVTRARQQVPIEAVLHAIHLAGRQVWRRARAVAEQRGVPVPLVVDARELYDEWAEHVRARLIVAHRDAELARAQSLRDRRLELLRRALTGGQAGAEAVREAGLRDGSLWLLHARPGDDASRLEQRLRTGVHDLFGVHDGALVGVVEELPEVTAGGPVAVVGPLHAAGLLDGARWAAATWEAAHRLGRGGLVPLTTLPVTTALGVADGLGGHLAAHRLASLDAEGGFGDILAETVIAYAEHGGRVDDAAAELFVHPNTVRHRLRRFARLTGLSPDEPFDVVAAWWLAQCRRARPG